MASITKSAFSPSQISQYLDYIRFPTSLREGPRDITFLRTLHALHIASIPYENLSLHYSPSPTVTLDPQSLFAKVILAGRGRGGYCLELSALYLHLLLGLGFTVHPSIARIRLRNGPVPQGTFIGYVHLTLIVTLEDGSRWSSDVAFGGDGPTCPMALVDGAESPTIGGQKGRLVRRVFHSASEDGWIDGGGLAPVEDPAKVIGLLREPGLNGRKAWIYQCANPGQPWASYYAFSGETATWDDLEAISAYVSGDDKGFQRMTMLGVKFLISAEALAEHGIDSTVAGAPWVLVPEGERLIAGKVMLVDDTFKRNTGGRTEVLRVCASEAERIDLLKVWFGIDLTEEQRHGIRGAVKEIKE